jgi:hypothetical protein
VDVDKLPNHLKLCVLYFGLFYHSNSLQWTEIHRAVMFDAVPKITPSNYYTAYVYGNKILEATS